MNRARKAKARGAAAAQADANRVAFGRTTVEKLNEKEESARRERDLDGARLEP